MTITVPFTLPKSISDSQTPLLIMGASKAEQPSFTSNAVFTTMMQMRLPNIYATTKAEIHKKSDGPPPAQ